MAARRMAPRPPAAHNRIVRFLLSFTAALLAAAALAPAATLTPAAVRAFDTYAAGVAPHLTKDHPKVGEVAIDPVNGGTWKVPGGMLHHWRATALVPGVRAEDLSTLLADSDHLARYYAPDVVSSRSLGRNRVLMRFKKKQVVTVILDAEFETEGGLTGPGRGYSISRSTHVWQVDDGRRLPEGDDDGYLWRLNSYWAFEETPAGLLMQCEAVSLTRDVPLGLGWLVMPIIRTLPRKSLEFTMTATRNALSAIVERRQNDGHAD